MLEMSKEIILMPKLHDLTRSGKSQHFLNSKSMFDLFQFLPVRLTNESKMVVQCLPSGEFQIASGASGYIQESASCTRLIGPGLCPCSSV